MRFRTISKCIILLAMDMVLISSCEKKAVAQEVDGAVVQASTKSTGATNSNETISLKPYPTVKWRNSVTIYQGRKKEDEKKPEPESQPISEPQVAEKTKEVVPPAEPSTPTASTQLPPSVEVKKDVELTPPAEPREKDIEEIPTPVVDEKPGKVEKVEEKVEHPAENEKTENEEPSPNQAEYQRSLGSVSSGITIQEFEEDKSSILAIIQKLEVVMKNKDYKSWLTYVDDASVKYWSTKKNLQKAQSRLPVKGLSLNNLQDYFKYVFIPSRNGRRVDEIRYETKESVKVVQVNDDSDTVYYYFKKSSNGAWKLHLPPISD